MLFSRPGQRNLITDVPGILVGNAEDHNVRTGVTVLTSPHPFVAGVHIMGGAPGTADTDLLAPDKLVDKVDALVLSGGSAFGLAAADGVRTALREEKRGYHLGGHYIPIVPTAILYDLSNGGTTSFARRCVTIHAWQYGRWNGRSCWHTQRRAWLILSPA